MVNRPALRWGIQIMYPVALQGTLVRLQLKHRCQFNGINLFFFLSILINLNCGGTLKVRVLNQGTTKRKHSSDGTPIGPSIRLNA